MLFFFFFFFDIRLYNNHHVSCPGGEESSKTAHGQQRERIGSERVTLHMCIENRERRKLEKKEGKRNLSKIKKKTGG
jgi:hypothetical protein